MGSFRSKEDDVAKISTSIFVLNFPDSVSAKDLFHSCKQYGHVVDSFIPMKRLKDGKRFGFVRFINVFNVERLVNNLCTIWLNRCKLHANIARFNRDQKNGNKYKTANQKKHEGRKNTFYDPSKEAGTFDSRNSFVNVLKGTNMVKETDSSPVIVLEEDCLNSKDLSNSLIGRVKDVGSLSNLKKVLCNEGRQIDDENDYDENVPLNYSINNHLSIQFGRDEFCLLTGLRFGVENREEYDTQANLPFRRRVFPSHLDGQHITGIDIENAILAPTFAELYNEDAVGLCCLGILQLVLLGAENRRNVPEWLLRIANDRVAWNLYPWGSYVWPTLYSQLRNATVRRWGPLYVDQPTNEDDRTTYSIFGYTWAFKTWILESFRVNAIRYFDRFNRYPRVAAWHKKKGRFTSEMVLRFFQGNIPVARLTPDDIEARSDWWISSKAYFDGIIDQVERVPFDLSRHNMYEIPSGISLGRFGVLAFDDIGVFGWLYGSHQDQEVRRWVDFVTDGGTIQHSENSMIAFFVPFFPWQSLPKSEGKDTQIDMAIYTTFEEAQMKGTHDAMWETVAYVFRHAHLDCKEMGSFAQVFINEENHIRLEERVEGPVTRNKHIMIDLGTSNNKKIDWPIKEKHGIIAIVETVPWIVR
ncbi:phospholipase-like protein [Tanacetum coccineum]